MIELLIVIAIIGILASVVLVNLGSARTKARESAALSTGMSILSILEICDINSEKIMSPSDSDSGGGNICSSVGTAWPKAPDGYSYHPTIWTSGEQNMFLIRAIGASPADSRDIYCGHYPSWTGRTDGLGRLGSGYGCAQHSNGVWK